jgi:superfamily II DNA/RNA helicase
LWSSRKRLDFLATLLSDSELSSTSIHGHRYQEQREAALKEFRIGKRDILVATNVAARGFGTYIQAMSLSPAKSLTYLQTFKV